VNREEAKDILLLYRHHHAADAQDPQITEALALAKVDPELAKWLEMHCARQFVLREKFRQIPVPEGLKEQIISEHRASLRRAPQKRQLVLAAVLAFASLLLLGIVYFQSRPPAADTLAVFQNRMVSYALRGYAMDLLTSDSEKIRAFFKEKNSPADFVLPENLKSVAQSGCAVQGWRDGKVSMVCFRTGKPLPPGTESDLWLFVAEEQSVKGALPDAAPQISKVNSLVTATWVKDGKLYLLGLEGDETDIRKFL
jgi:hypothetical protein